MSQGMVFTAMDQALCLAVLKQIEVGRIDYELLRQELGLPTKGAAQVRWSRFNTKLKASVGNAPVKKASKNPPATPKSKAISKGKKSSSNKKRKIESSDEEEETDTPNTSQDEIKDDEVDGDVVMEAAETPTRKLPIRRARVKSFKEESDGDADGDREQEEEADDEKEFQDSGHGSTAAEPTEEGQSDEEV